jgi:hypothetical protein
MTRRDPYLDLHKQATPVKPGGMAVIIVLLVLVAFGIVAWLTNEAVREHRRRRQITGIRAQFDQRPTVAELRARCHADTLPRYPTWERTDTLSQIVAELLALPAPTDRLAPHLAVATAPKLRTT